MTEREKNILQLKNDASYFIQLREKLYRVLGDPELSKDTELVDGLLSQMKKYAKKVQKINV